jgi:hypothetical protein
VSSFVLVIPVRDVFTNIQISSSCGTFIVFGAATPSSSALLQVAQKRNAEVLTTK